MMERLTKVNEYGAVEPATRLSSLEEDNEWNAECRERLAYYEDFEERGKLLMLPYPISTERVYFLDTDNEVYILNYRNLAIEWIPEDNKVMYIIDSFEFYIEDFGKRVFLTHEEMDMKLKEI